MFGCLYWRNKPLKRLLWHSVASVADVHDISIQRTITTDAQ